MKISLLFLALVTMALTASSQSTQPASGGLPDSNKVIFNEAVALYDGCAAENADLKQQVNGCQAAQIVVRKIIADADSTINEQQVQIDKLEGINLAEYKIIGNDNRILKDTKHIATRRIIGFTLGGFTVGISIPLIFLLLKH